MTHTGNTDRLTPVTQRTAAFPVLTLGQDTLRRIIGLIQLSFGVLDGLLGLRFLLKLMAANPDNPFALLLYFVTDPFLWLFKGLTRTPTFEGIVIEFYDLVAIAVYAMLGWVIIQLIWILFARRGSA
jgi:YggT family protein